MPDWLVGVVMQIPLVAAVTYAFLRGLVHSHAELERREAEHQAELNRRTDTLSNQINDWRTLYSQERADRIAADTRLAAAVAEIKDAASRVEELTKEVIRHGPRNGPRA